jgi:hypothetical protein
MANEELPAFLLGMFQVQAADTSVMIVPKGERTEFIFEHTKAQVQWLTKAIRYHNELYLLTASSAIGKWSSNKPLFLKVMNSFKRGAL